MQLAVASAIICGNNARSFYLATLKHLGNFLLDRLRTTHFYWLILHVLFKLKLLLGETVFIVP